MSDIYTIGIQFIVYVVSVVVAYYYGGKHKSVNLENKVLKSVIEDNKKIREQRDKNKEEKLPFRAAVFFGEPKPLPTQFGHFFP